MASVLAAVTAVHLLFGALWTGGVVFVVWRLLPLVSAGESSVAPARRTAGGTRWLTRISAVVTLLTGRHMTAQLYDRLADRHRPKARRADDDRPPAGDGQTRRGRALVAHHALDVGKTRTAGRESRTPLRAAGIVAVVLLVLGGWRRPVSPDRRGSPESPGPDTPDFVCSVLGG